MVRLSVTSAGTGSQKLGVFSGRCWETGGQVKICEDDMVGFAIAGRLGEDTHGGRCRGFCNGIDTEMGHRSGGGFAKDLCNRKAKQREMQALVEQFDCRRSSDSVGAD